VLTYAPLDDPTRPLPDARLRGRLDILLEQFTAQPSCTIPQATEDRNGMDAAYGFFANPRVGLSAIVATCLPQTLERLHGCSRVLAAQDTTDGNFSGLKAAAELGYTADQVPRGLLLHSTLAVRPDGLPIGLITQQVWTRDPARKGRAKGRRRRASIDKESFRWLDHARATAAVLPADVTVVHVADRAGDIDEWLAAERPANAQLLIRVAQAHRLVAHGPDGTEGKLSVIVRAQSPLGQHTIEVPRADDRPARQAVTTLRVAAVDVPPPKHAKQRAKLPQVPVWVVEAVEENPPAGAEALCWRLVTTEPVTTLEEAIRALSEYVLRWRIETNQPDCTSRQRWVTRRSVAYHLCERAA
jgi:hypothetical protein